MRQLPADPFFEGKKDAQHVAQLCAETIDEGNSVLIFCATKKVQRRHDKGALLSLAYAAFCAASVTEKVICM